jgi:hypothetical protein
LRRAEREGAASAEELVSAIQGRCEGLILVIIGIMHGGRDLAALREPGRLP